MKNAIDLARKGETEDDRREEQDRRSRRAKARRMVLAAPSETQARFARYAAFLKNNPDWPSNALLRRRAEARLWQEKADAATVRAFFAERRR